MRFPDAARVATHAGRPSSAVPLRLGVALVTGLALAGCAVRTAGTTGGDPATSMSSAVSVVATDTSCRLSTASVPAGGVRFVVSNKGQAPVRFSVLGADGATTLAEIEDIGPGASGTLQYTVIAGTYGFACDPGMVETAQVRGVFAVTG